MSLEETQNVYNLIGRLNAGGSNITVDSTLSDDSTNPVESKAIKEYVDDNNGTIKYLTTRFPVKFNSEDYRYNKHGLDRYARYVTDWYESQYSYMYQYIFRLDYMTNVCVQNSSNNSEYQNYVVNKTNYELKDIIDFSSEKFQDFDDNLSRLVAITPSGEQTMTLDDFADLPDTLGLDYSTSARAYINFLKAPDDINTGFVDVTYVCNFQFYSREDLDTFKSTLTPLWDMVEFIELTQFYQPEFKETIETEFIDE